MGNFSVSPIENLSRSRALRGWPKPGSFMGSVDVAIDGQTDADRDAQHSGVLICVFQLLLIRKRP